MGTASDTVDRPMRITAASAPEVPEVVEPLFREYGEWVAARLEQELGVTVGAADIERHHDAFREEIPALLATRGRLLVARLGDAPIGVGALKPVDFTTAEVKRMYVRPAAQGLGVGRAILERLVRDASAEGYATVRLETLQFMTAARALYQAFGFAEVDRFDGSEATDTVFDPITIAMRLDLAPGSA